MQIADGHDVQITQHANGDALGPVEISLFGDRQNGRSLQVTIVSGGDATVVDAFDALLRGNWPDGTRIPKDGEQVSGGGTTGLYSKEQWMPDERLDNLLLVEAEALLEANARASLILAVTALEVALSSTIADLAPDTKWLLDSQMPPVVSVLREYLNTLPTEMRIAGVKQRPSKEIVRTIQLAVQKRNRVIHAGESIDDADNVADSIRAVRQVLRLLDFYRGNDWAKDFIIQSSIRE